MFILNKNCTEHLGNAVAQNKSNRPTVIVSENTRCARNDRHSHEHIRLTPFTLLVNSRIDMSWSGLHQNRICCCFQFIHAMDVSLVINTFLNGLLYLLFWLLGDQ